VELCAIVFDLPPVVGAAQEQISRSSAAARITTKAGDFFEDDLPDADVFALGRVVHDWSEPRIGALLQKIHDRLPRGGALLVAEKLLEEEKTRPIPALLQSLNMLVATEGRERSLSEYRTLLESAGFRHVQGRITGAPLDAIFTVKA
jgi:acetylserotonin N-methyltransferase